MKNWRREAALKTMPLIAENRVRTPWREFWRRFRGQPVALLAGLFVLVLIVLAVIARGLRRSTQRTTSIMTGSTKAPR